MLITYTPGPREYDGPPKIGDLPRDMEPREFVFKPNKLLSAEAEAIEDATDWTFEEFGAKFLKGSMKAKRAALWIMLKREYPSLKFRDLSFTPDEVSVDFDADEKAALRESLAESADIDPEQRAEILALLGDEPAPKDETTTSEPAA